MAGKIDVCVSGPRVCVLMINSPNIPAYGHSAAIVNYMYASRHGYDFVVQRCPRADDMGKDWMWNGDNEYLLVWSKPALCRRYLQFYDYVLFIDSDAVVVDADMSVDRFLRENDVPDEACIVAAEDCRDLAHCERVPEMRDLVNTGVLLVRNSPRTFQLLQEWMDAPTTPECEQWKHVHTREQACLNVLRKRFGDAVHTVPVRQMNGSDGTFVRHFMSTSAEFRNATIGGLMCDAPIFRQQCGAPPRGLLWRWSLLLLLLLLLLAVVTFSGLSA